jgi:Ca-activated chloride channel family protein
LLLAVFVTALMPACARAQPARPLTESEVVKRVQLLTPDELVAELGRRGVDFAADDDALSRLEKAGASRAVLDAVRKAAPSARPAAGLRAVTYDHILELVKAGVDEAVVLKRLENSPTRFTLSADQVDALKRAGAGDKVLAAMQGASAGAGAGGMGDVTDLVLILDCSGSMIDKTKDGRTKMEVAKEVISDLILSVPDGRRLCLIVYGHNRELKCQAVEVVQELAPMDVTLKLRLVAGVERLQPVGCTPIALALRTAGRELARAQGNSGLILLTDGMETCNGDPNREAAKLAEVPGLKFGIHVIGFDVEPKERAAVEGIARAGKGQFYDARSAEKLQHTVAALRKEIVKGAAPKLNEDSPEIKALLEALKDRDGAVRREAADGLRRAGVRSPAVVDALKQRIADDVWIPKPRFVGTKPTGDPVYGGKQAALDALRELAPDEVSPALQMACKSRNADVRAWAAGELTHPSASAAADDPAASPAPPAALPAPVRGLAPQAPLLQQPPKKRFVGFGRDQGK